MAIITLFVAYFLGALWFLISRSTFNTGFLQENPNKTFIISQELKEKAPIF